LVLSNDEYGFIYVCDVKYITRTLFLCNMCSVE